MGGVAVGGGNPVLIQSMAKAKTSDVLRVIREIRQLQSLGCEIIRVAVKDMDDARAIGIIKKKTTLPLVADIHFNWKLAIEAIDNGVDKIRLNPGNIYKKNEVRSIVTAARSAHIPIRVGLNSGSVGISGNPVKRMISVCREYIRILEKMRFYDIVLSFKSSDIFDTIEVNKRMSLLCDYPLHLGVTATGGYHAGIVKSSLAIGTLLLKGVGDTIRVSLTADPQEEVIAARNILQSLKVRNFGPQIISCPTCGRCEVDLIRMTRELERKLIRSRYQRSRAESIPLSVAVMGCVVNGPGEAKQADIGIAFGRKNGLLFKKGKSLKKVSSGDCVKVLLEEIDKFYNQSSKVKK